MALIPGTNTPITINNVNNGWAAGGTSPSGPCTNCGYFTDNTGGNSVQYDGMTTVLTAATQVCPCETYHIKLAVEDFCDGAFDSGVFLEGNSFQSVGEIPVLTTGGQYTQVADTLYICPGDSSKTRCIFLPRTTMVNRRHYHFHLGNTAGCLLYFYCQSSIMFCILCFDLCSVYKSGSHFIRKRTN
ncbi:MAG: choice-of-anchor L domain-containing protein [Bacteroidetes bacterium]|nr:choice-of-anchor L domain-containing protein [Bacteroidota bacterium]